MFLHASAYEYVTFALSICIQNTKEDTKRVKCEYIKVCFNRNINENMSVIEIYESIFVIEVCENAFIK